MGTHRLLLAILPTGSSTHSIHPFIQKKLPTVLTNSSPSQQLTAVQWLIDFYPQGKTSIDSRFNLPGKWAWFIMEIPGFLIVLYCAFTLPVKLGLSSPSPSASAAAAAGEQGLPYANWTMITLYTIHYIYRAILSPLLLNPSMSPIHPIVFCSAFAWQVLNGLSLGGWLAGYGPTTVYDWAGRLYSMEIGLVIFGWAFLGNIFHDDDLREIRRAAGRRQKEAQAEAEAKQATQNNPAAAETTTTTKLEGTTQKLYMLPKNGLFHFILYPHYLCEWIEWFGFYMIGGWDCIPARTFLINEISTMLPRALAGRRWYVEKFGKERVGRRKAIIPGVL